MHSHFGIAGIKCSPRKLYHGVDEWTKVQRQALPGMARIALQPFTEYGS
jgi:hypothetical protein